MEDLPFRTGTVCLWRHPLGDAKGGKYNLIAQHVVSI